MPNRPQRPSMRPDSAAGNRLDCGKPGKHATLLADAGFDAFEQGCLAVLRRCFATMTGPQAPHLPQSLEPLLMAQHLFGAGPGAALKQALQELVQIMATSRSQPFVYSNPWCMGCAQVLTATERRLILILHHLRRGQSGRAIAEALMLCDARPVGPVIEAAYGVIGQPAAQAVPPRAA